MADRWRRLQEREDEMPWQPIAAEHECWKCSQIVFYARVGDPKTDDLSGTPHECGEQAPVLAPAAGLPAGRDPIPATARRGGVTHQPEKAVAPRRPVTSRKPRRRVIE